MSSTRRIPRRLLIDASLDLVLLVAYTLDYNFRFTGIPVHEWLGVGFAVALVLHLALHWDWVMRTTRKLFRSAPWRERAKWIVDLLLYISMAAVVVSGLLISRHAMPAIGWKPADDRFNRQLHEVGATLTILLVALHLGLNWRWMVTTTKRLLGRGPSRRSVVAMPDSEPLDAAVTAATVMSTTEATS